MTSSNLTFLDVLLQEWRQLLSLWAQNGALTRAAQESLLLGEEPELLRQFVARWSAGDFHDLPPIELLPAASMPGAAGAYAPSTGTIYLNADWQQRASQEQVLAMLTEELGHHLDGLLNSSDTPGDEGELFAALLHGDGVVSAQQRQRLLNENDHGSVLVYGQAVQVQQANLTSTNIQPSYPGRTHGEVGSEGAFAALRNDGSVVTWGGGWDSSGGGDSSLVAELISSGVSQIFSNFYAFAALKSDGSVVTWGAAGAGGDSNDVKDHIGFGVTQIFSNYQAFAALKADGSVVTWGTSYYGGDSSAVVGQINSGVTKVFSTEFAFAALKADGSVVTWGSSDWGGDSSGVTGQISSNVSQIFSTRGAFAALKADGSVVTWGNPSYGGDKAGVAAQLNSGVRKIFTTEGHFAALRADGSVVIWGLSSGGDLPSNLSSDVTHIFSTHYAFAALKADGSVVTWGVDSYGGSMGDASAQLTAGVKHIFSTGNAFAALKENGSVVTWGNRDNGGNSNPVASRISSGVIQIFSTGGAFAALKSNGSVVTWGNSFHGGDSSSVEEQLSSGVEQIFSTGYAFAALKSDGSVVTWGHPDYGGSNSGVAGQLANVVAFANPFTDDRLVLGGVGGTNKGPASFTVSGLLAPNNYLHAVLRSADPDGNGSFNYSWQTSSNGSSWTSVGSNRASYRLAANDAGKQVRLLVSYKDGGGFNEIVVTAAGTVAYIPSHEILEILAKDSIYEPTHTVGASILGQFGSPYTIDWILNGAAGLYALGLAAANAAPVLVLRGTSPTDVLDIWDDINPDGIGHGQFTQNITEIRNWLLTRSVSMPPVIVGHSLGGALAQWIAADATHNLNRRLGEVVTFNSPGIAPLLNFNGIAIGASTFKKELAGLTTHYITSPDAISLGGLSYINGSAMLADYDAELLYLGFWGPHLDPVLVDRLPISKRTRVEKGRILSGLDFSTLGSPGFSYLSDYDFVERRLVVSGIALGLLATGNVPLGTLVFGLNAALVSRASTESFRQSLGSIPDALLAALRFALDAPAIIAEMATERVQEGIASLKAGGAAALEATKAYSSETWKKIASITAPKWRETRSWTSNAWRDTVSWTTDTWQAISGAAFNFAKPFITTAVKQVFRLPTTPGFLPLAAAASFEPFSAEDQASPDQPTALRSFSLASFAAPDAVQTIGVSVALSQASAELVTLQFQTMDRTAQAGVDYRALSGTLQFQPGETEKFVTIELLTPPQASAKDFALRLSNLQNAQFLASEEIVVSLLANQAPVVASAPADRFAPIEEPLFFALPPDTFSDANSSDGDQLAYSASLSDGSPLPAWLQFDPQTLSFTGTPPASALGSLAIVVIASDSAQSQATAIFALRLVANDGAASFTISGTASVGNTLTATNSSPDPDGDGDFTFSWQASTDGSSWSPVGTNSSSYLAASADQGKQLRLVVSYTDLQGFPESVTTAAGTVPFVNDGPASFSITGTPTIGNTLVAITSSPDPDGNGTFSYSWQSSSNGTIWLTVGSQSSLLITTALAGRQLRLMVAYQDGQSFDESVTVPYGLVPLPAGAPQQTVVITALSDNLGILQGTIAEGAISNDTTPTLTGTLSAALGSSETLRVYRNGATAGTATVLGLNWAYTPTTPLAGNGIHSFTAAVVKGSGLSGQVSDPRSILLDATAPTQTVTISGVSDNSDPVQGAVAAGGRTNDTTPTISGNLSAPIGEGETLKLYNGNTFLVDAVVDATTLTWTATPTLAANGTYTLRARVQDQAGNQGPLSAGRTLIFDTVAPAQTVTISGLSDNVGITQGPIADGGTTNDTTPTLSGTLSAVLGTSEVLTIYRDGVAAGNAAVNASTLFWSYTLSPALSANGTYVFTAAVVDGAGNSGTPSAARSMVLDITAPTQPVTITGVSDDTDPSQGTVVAGGRTNDTTPTLSGNLSAALGAGETLKLYNGTTVLVDAVVDPTSLTWTATPTLAANGTYTLRARVQDQAGNQGPLSAGRSLILDTVAPAQTVTISGLSDNVGITQGPIADGGTTNDTTPTLSGTFSTALGPSEVLRVYRDGVLAGNATVNATTRAWSYTPATPLSANGIYVFTAAVVDGAGNVGPLSDPWKMQLEAPISTADRDDLTGTTAADTFLLPQLDWSLLGAAGNPTYDTVTGYQSTDRLQLLGRTFKTRLTSSAGVATSLGPADIANTLTPNWADNSARAFTVTGLSGTFVALNDAQVGYQPDSDAILFLQGYNASVVNSIALV
jgi:alpha-tubulin suppressor-like RCC1 family protein